MSRDRSKEIKSGIQTFLDHVKSLESTGDDGFVEEYGVSILFIFSESKDSVSV